MSKSMLRLLFAVLMAFAFVAPLTTTHNAVAEEAAGKKGTTYLKPYAKSESTGAYAMWGGEYVSNVGNVYFKITGKEVIGNWKSGELKGKIVEFRGTFQIEYEWFTAHTGEKGAGIFALNAQNSNMLIGSFWFTAVGEGSIPKGKYDWAITRTGK